MSGAIDAPLVRRLVTAQFPRWAELPVRPVEPGGWDNRTFRLGEDLCVRLPSAERYAAQVEKEQRWLPELAPHLPLPIPVPLAMGVPGEGYPWHWSVYRWLEGESADRGRNHHLPGLARALAGFLQALHRIDPTGGPPPGEHNFFRGGPVGTYDEETREAIAALGPEIDTGAATAVWEEALASGWRNPPVWLHGDLCASNLLVRDGRLSAVIDFGSTGVGDPACDLTIAWAFFAGEGREAFHAALDLDPPTWARARGWALWKALITMAEPGNRSAQELAGTRRTIEDVLTVSSGHA